MTGQGGLDRDAAGLEVTNLSHEDHVRVLAQDGAQSLGVGHVDFGVDRDLDQTLDVVLDGVLVGDDLLVDGVDVAEAAVEGRRLAGAGRSRDQDHAVGLGDQGLDDLEVLGPDAEVVDVEVDVAAVQDPHHDRFAPDHGQGRDADIDGLAADVQLDAPVLGEARLGDVEVGHDLDAAGHSASEVRRGRGLDVVEDPVDSLPDLKHLLEGLEVNVSRLVLDRLEEDQVDELDDGRRGRHRLEVGVPAARSVVEDLHVVGVEAGLGQGVLEGRLLDGPVVARDGAVDRVRRRDRAADLEVEHEAEVFEDRRVHGVAEGDHDHAAFLSHGDDAVGHSEGLRNEVDDRLLDLFLVEVGDLHSGLLCEREENVLWGDVAELSQDVAQLAPLLALDRESFVDVLDVHEAHFDQDLANVAHGACLLPGGRRAWRRGSELGQTRASHDAQVPSGRRRRRRRLRPSPPRGSWRAFRSG